MTYSFPGQENWEFPTYEKKEFFSKKNKYCVCIFVINEGGKVQKQLKKMKKLSKMVDIIIADGGSTDGSLEPDFLKENNVRVLLTKTGKGKLSSQMRMAFHYALTAGYEGLITIDGNNKDDSSAISLFVEALDAGYDHVQGSRFIEGGFHENTPLGRLLAVKFIHAPLISLASRHRYTDTTNGFRAYSAKLLLDERVRPFREVFERYEMHYYLAIRSAQLGMKIKEVPVSRVYPAHGPTPTKITPMRGNILVLKTLLNACLKKYNPKD